MSSHSASMPGQSRPAPEVHGGASAVWKVVALLLGFAVGALAIAAVVAVQAADQARDEAAAATGGVAAPAGAVHDHSTHAAATTAGQSLPLQSFAGTTAPNAEALAQAHVAYDATLPPVPAGNLAKIHMTLKDMTVQIAPSLESTPGPSTACRAGADPPRPAGPDRPDDAHQWWRDPALDRLPRRPDRPERRLPGRRPRRLVHVPLRGERPRRLHVPLRDEAGPRHIANGMYGALVVDPATPLPKADNEYVLVASEWYLNGDGVSAPPPWTWTRPARYARLDDVQRVCQPVRDPSPHGEAR